MKLLGQPGRSGQSWVGRAARHAGAPEDRASRPQNLRGIPSERLLRRWVHACVCGTHERLGRVTSQEPTGSDQGRLRRVALSRRARRPGRGQRESSFARNFLHSRSSSEKRQQFQNGVSGFRLAPTLTLSCTHFRKAHRLQSSLPILTGQGHRDD